MITAPSDNEHQESNSTCWHDYCSRSATGLHDLPPVWHGPVQRRVSGKFGLGLRQRPDLGRDGRGGGRAGCGPSGALSHARGHTGALEGQEGAGSRANRIGLMKALSWIDSEGGSEGAKAQHPLQGGVLCLEGRLTRRSVASVAAAPSKHRSSTRKADCCGVSVPACSRVLPFAPARLASSIHPSPTFHLSLRRVLSRRLATPVLNHKCASGCQKTIRIKLIPGSRCGL